MNLSTQKSTNILVPLPTSANGSFDGPWYGRTSITHRIGSSSSKSSSNIEPSSLSVDQLAQYAQREMRRYLQTSDADTQYGYELFRRALDIRDEAAWYALSQCYWTLVKSWVMNHPRFSDSGEEADYFVNRAFERLWRYVALPEKFANFEDLASFLQYIKMSVHSAVIDDAPNAPAVVECPETLNSQLAEQDRLDEVEQNEFWLLVEKLLVDETERIVISGFFIEGLQNREILALYPEHFTDAKQVSNKRTSILRRLSRDVEFKEVLQDFFYDDRDRLGSLIC